MGFPGEAGDAVEGQGAAGPDRADAGAGRALRESATARAAVPAGLELAMFGMGCFWGAERKFWEAPRRVLDRGRLRRRATRRTPPTRRCAAASPATTRSCWWCSIPSRSRYEELLQDVLGEPRPDPGHASGQRRRHAVPLGDLHLHGGAAAAAAEASRDAYQQALRARGYGAITTEILDAPEFYYAEDYHQQYLAKNPGGYCGLGGTGVACSDSACRGRPASAPSPPARPALAAGAACRGAARRAAAARRPPR